MATTPSFITTPKTWSIVTPTTADTTYTAATLDTANHSAVVADPTASTIGVIRWIRVSQIVDTAAAGVINLFLFNGTIYYYFDHFTYGEEDQSTTQVADHQEKFYDDLIIPDGWSLKCSVTTSDGQSAFHVIAIGGEI